MYKRIVVPLDGSKLAEAPLDYAVWLAHKSAAELQLMHVYNNRVPAVSRYLGNRIERTMRRSVLAYRAPVNVKPVIAAGDAATQITKHVEDNDVDLIIMSTHGRSGIKRWMMGSVADKVVRYSNRPVRLIKSFESKVPDSEEYDKKVLVLLDGSELSEQILPYAAYHAGLSGGELILLNVCEPPDVAPAVTYHLIPPHDYPPTRPLQWGKYVEEETERRKKECQVYLNDLTEKFRQRNLKVRFAAPFGNAVDEILRFLEDNPVSLVAMTTRGRSGISRWVFGSVAEKVLLASPSPVLLIRPA